MVFRGYGVVMFLDFGRTWDHAMGAPAAPIEIFARFQQPAIIDSLMLAAGWLPGRLAGWLGLTAAGWILGC